MKSEKGQAIVFLALGFIAFLGFVALALDGGMLYADRRNAQNGSDASSLGGAGAAALELSNNSYDHPQATYPEWDCGSYWVQEAAYLGTNAAIARGGSNNFSLDTDMSDLTYVATSCHDNWNGSFFDRWLDVTVGISDTTETSFAQLLFPDPLHNVVSSTARVRPRAPFGFGNAIIALRNYCLNPMDEGGARFFGSINVNISGGSIFSNACFRTAGGQSQFRVVIDPPDLPNVCIPWEGSGGECWIDDGNPNINPAPTPGTQPIPPSAVYVTPPTNAQCGPDRGSVDLRNAHQTLTIDPGTYTDISVNGGTLYLNPGLYCIEPPANGNGGNVKFNGGTIEGPTGYVEGAENPFQTGVAFYLTQGSFETTGNAVVRLTAAMPGACQTFPCPGITQSLEAVLIYLAQGNTNQVKLTGTDDTVYTGLVYAPAGYVNLIGDADVEANFNLQVVADTVLVRGNGTININYDDEWQRWTSAMIELAR